MSWDAWVEIETGAGNRIAEESRNYTHNCNEMMRRSLAATGHLEQLGERHLYALDGIACMEAKQMLTDALAWWGENRAELAKLNPANCWGDEASALDFWRWVLQQCEEHPLATLRMNG